MAFRYEIPGDGEIIIFDETGTIYCPDLISAVEDSTFLPMELNYFS